MLFVRQKSSALRRTVNVLTAGPLPFRRESCRRADAVIGGKVVIGRRRLRRTLRRGDGRWQLGQLPVGVQDVEVEVAGDVDLGRRGLRGLDRKVDESLVLRVREHVLNEELRLRLERHQLLVELLVLLHELGGFHGDVQEAGFGEDVGRAGIPGPALRITLEE